MDAVPETTSSGATLVTRTPLDKITCKIARAPGSLDVKSLVGKISRIRFSSCACELAYLMATFWLAYFWYLEAKARGESTVIHEQRLLQWLSAFNMHYSREYALLELPWPLLAGMRSLTPRRSAKGYTLSRRPGLDIVRAQKAVDRSFCAKYFCSDRCMNQLSQVPSTPSTRRLVDDVAARVSRQSF